MVQKDVFRNYNLEKLTRDAQKLAPKKKNNIGHLITIKKNKQ